MGRIHCQNPHFYSPYWLTFVHSSPYSHIAARIIFLKIKFMHGISLLRRLLRPRCLKDTVSHSFFCNSITLWSSFSYRNFLCGMSFFCSHVFISCKTLRSTGTENVSFYLPIFSTWHIVWHTIDAQEIFG